MNEKKERTVFHIVKRDALPWYQSVGIPGNCHCTGTDRMRYCNDHYNRY